MVEFMHFRTEPRALVPVPRNFLLNSVLILNVLRRNPTCVRLSISSLYLASHPSQPPNLCLVSERLEMSVRDLLSSPAPIRTSQALQMAIDACRGVAVLHARRPPMLHRDLKASNLLVDTTGGSSSSASASATTSAGGGSSWGRASAASAGRAGGAFRVCVCDFGLARTKRRNQARLTICGTTAWLAPEIFKGEGWTEKADTYSLGIVLFELFSRRLPYEDVESPQAVAFKVWRLFSS
jgi:serine/threonine protein kinase